MLKFSTFFGGGGILAALDVIIGHILTKAVNFSVKNCHNFFFTYEVEMGIKSTKWKVR